MNNKILSYFKIFSFIGLFWLVVKSIKIQCMLIDKSIWNIINPFFHLKVSWILLQDIDTYIVLLCFFVYFYISKDE